MSVHGIEQSDLGQSLAVIVAEASDEGAAALARATSLRTSATQVALIQPVQLALARWTHRVDPKGVTRTTVDLLDGRRLADEQIGAVVFRASALPVPSFINSKAVDRDYAATELLALVVSWLRGLGERVVNRIDGISPVGPSWSCRRWLVEAQRTGLPVMPSVSATSARLIPGWHGHPFAARSPFESDRAESVAEVVVVGLTALGDASAQYGDAGLRLAARSRCNLLQINFCEEAGNLAVASVSTVPFLGSNDQVDAAANLLAARTQLRVRA